MNIQIDNWNHKELNHSPCIIALTASFYHLITIGYVQPELLLATRAIVSFSGPCFGSNGLLLRVWDSWR